MDNDIYRIFDRMIDVQEKLTKYDAYSNTRRLELEKIKHELTIGAYNGR